MSQTAIDNFQKTVWDYFATSKRDLPWRIPRPDGSFDAYHVVVSELMLQQTQVARVMPKYEAFIKAFPEITNLAKAPLSDVLKLWSGLGYNRRAKYLWQTAKLLEKKPQPWSYETLRDCPGIGPNTAGAIIVYAYNYPRLFIETNVRSVFIHHFFKDTNGVDDKAILPLLDQALNGQDPRTFYWALMDYGTHLKSTYGNTARRSKHYTTQTAFAGSTRQLRGRIIKLLTERQYQQTELSEQLADPRTQTVLAALQREGLISKRGKSYHLTYS